MNKLTKILVPVLALALLLGAMIGVSASASDEPTTPEIASMNVEYSSQLYLYYAVPVIDDNGDGENDDVVLNVYKDAECQELLYSVNGTVETIAALGGGSYYVYNTSGVAAKELNTCEYVQAVNTETGAKSEVVEYSVEQYLYTKLYDEGYALMTEDDGKEYIRRTLYYDLLKYGSTAQQLFTPEATDKIADRYVLSISNADVESGEIELGDEIALNYVAPEGEKRTFNNWEYTVFGTYGDVITSGVANNGETITAQGNVIVNTVYSTKNEITFDNDEYDSNYFTPGTVVDASVQSVTIADGKYTISQTASASSGISTIIKPTAPNADANVTVMEFDVCFAEGSTPKVEIYFGDVASPNKRTAYGGLYLYKTSGVVKMYSFKNNATGTGTATKVADFGETVTVRIEFIEGTVGEAKINVYVDDTLTYETTDITGTAYNVEGYSEVLDASAITTMRIATSSSNLGTVTFDNISVVQLYRAEE